MCSDLQNQREKKKKKPTTHSAAHGRILKKEAKAKPKSSLKLKQEIMFSLPDTVGNCR